MSFDPFIPSDEFNPDIPSDGDGIVVNETMQPPFETWVEGKLNPIFSAVDREDFDIAFNDLASTDIDELDVFYGIEVPRDEFKNKLWEEIAAHGGRVRRIHIVAEPSDDAERLASTYYLGSNVYPWVTLIQTGQARVRVEAQDKTYDLELRYILNHRGTYWYLDTVFPKYQGHY